MQKPQNPNNDTPLMQPPSDSVSSMAWSPRANFLAAGSWDNEVRIWEVANNGSSRPVKLYKHKGPVLDVTWDSSGAHIFSSSADNTVMCQDLRSQKLFQVAQHTKPIKAIKWVPKFPALLTAGWDNQMKGWDCRKSSAAFTIKLPDKAFAMDCVAPMIVVATAERRIGIYDVRNLNKAVKWMYSPLKFQTRCIAIQPNNAQYFAIGSIEGRVGVYHFGTYPGSKKNFVFKCHRQGSAPNSVICGVNKIDFHPKLGTFATCGNDGTVRFWDKGSKHRLKGFKPVNMPVSTCAFNATGQIFAYAASYDWSKGGAPFVNGIQKKQNNIYLHSVAAHEVKPKGSGNF